MRIFFLSVDYQIFQFFNGLGGRSDFLDQVFRFCAEGILLLLIAGLALFVLQKHEQIRYRAPMEAIGAGFLGGAIFAPLLNLLFFRDRPFIDFTVHQLLTRNPIGASYPSWHATVMFAIAFIMLFRNKNWGIVYLILALISALSRIVVGVHFPSDILGGIGVGFISAMVVWGVPQIKKSL